MSIRGCPTSGFDAMTYQLSIEQKPAYLHATVTGENTKENILGYIAELLEVCRARGCFRVLIEERLDGPRLDICDVFEIASEGSGRASGTMKAIAYVDVHAVGDMMKFAENVAVNRGLPLAIFPTVAEAEKWLNKPAGP